MIEIYEVVHNYTDIDEMDDKLFENSEVVARFTNLDDANRYAKEHTLNPDPDGVVDYEGYDVFYGQLDVNCVEVAESFDESIDTELANPLGIGL